MLSVTFKPSMPIVIMLNVILLIVVAPKGLLYDHSMQGMLSSKVELELNELPYFIEYNVHMSIVGT
jgi:hypothetical protein